MSTPASVGYFEEEGLGAIGVLQILESGVARHQLGECIPRLRGRGELMTKKLNSVHRTSELVPSCPHTNTHTQ